MRFRFCDPTGRSVPANKWLLVWAARYPSDNYAGYDELVTKRGRLSADDVEQIGKWKDAARTPGKWKPNVASVAYPVWMQAASERPICPNEDHVAEFLNDWSERSYTDNFASKPVVKRFGLSRATTLLHFISGGRFPIFDSRVRRALARLLDAPVPNTIRWYLDSYCPMFLQIAALCGTEDLRRVDKALFSYGGKTLAKSHRQVQ